MKLQPSTKTTIKVYTYTNTILKSMMLNREAVEDVIVRLMKRCGIEMQQHHFIEDGKLTYEVIQELRPVTLIYKVFKDNKMHNPSEIFTQEQKKEKEKQCEELLKEAEE